MDQSKLYEDLRNQLLDIKLEKGIKWEDSPKSLTKIIEKQTTYIWTRLFLKEELSDIEPGDDVILTYIPSGEQLETKFVCYAKSDSNKNIEDEITQFNTEDDKKILCLMVNQDTINVSDEIPFIRTLFKEGRHFEYQLFKRDELVFTNKRTNKTIEYFDCSY
jgi:hypothetical protein